MENLKIAYLYPEYSNKSGDYTHLLDERVGDGQGNFKWLNKDNRNWYIDTQENPDLLFFNGKYYKYGKDGHRKATLNSLELINKRVETTNEQPIEFDKLSKTKQNLLLTCYYAIKCVDDSKISPLEIDIEEEAAVTTRELIEIRSGSIDFGVKVNNIDVIDKNIEW